MANGTTTTNGTNPFRVLFHHEVDVAMSVMALSYERFPIVRFSPCIDTIPFSILSSSSPPQFDAFSYIHAFDVEVSCSPERYVHSSQRLLLAVWLLTVVVLANTFGSLLKSQQAVSKFIPEVDGIDDLAARPYLTPIIPGGNYFQDYAKFSHSMSVKKVWARSRARGANLLPPHELFSDSTLALVAARRAVVLVEQGSILLRIARFCERENIRSFVVAKHPLDRSPYGYVFSKFIEEGFFRKIFAKLRRLLETGLMHKWVADSQGNWQRCLQTKDNTVESISLKDTTPFFLLWGFMCGLAFCAFLCELGCIRVFKRHRADSR
ncbi:hypothetical protein HPB50_012261 [Hyalomma asiaticum]|uniref:Uncharacterized protein n=1 Tax=Hyalomma asiaticum TaxID=266040 RepID=A0ACB7SBY2_HYAAI|nr:hypothetical protein HPB50_012261 [Hyalomma asiaticum]